MRISRCLALLVFALALGPPGIAQVVGPVSITSTQCAAIDIAQSGTVGISVTGTWSGTLQPEVAIGGDAPGNVQVTPSTSSTAQSTITANGVYSASVTGGTTFQLCGNTVASGTAVVKLNGVRLAHGGGSGSGLPSGCTGTSGTITCSVLATSNLNGGIVGTEGTCAALTTAAGVDLMCPSSTSGPLGTHGWVCSVNGGAWTACGANLPDLTDSPGVSITSTVPLILPVGSLGTLAFQWAGNTNFGMYFGLGGTNFVGNGAIMLQVNGSDVQFNSALADYNTGQNIIDINTTSGLINLRGTNNPVLKATNNSVALVTSDWSCGTGGTVSSCTTATIIGSGGNTPLTFALPHLAKDWTLECDVVVGQATGVTANNWNLLTATNGATNVTAFYDMHTAAGTDLSGTTTDQASTTTTFSVGGTWTLGATATKMPAHLFARIEGASASGTTVSLQLVAPTVGDLVTIYRGSSCHVL